MLVQHLLTERLFRKIFDNPEFIQRNVIAAEVEKVIDALVQQEFQPRRISQELDRFYVAIENAARTMPEFSDKQHFLNTVYERFSRATRSSLADTHGIVYTPQAIVDFMSRQRRCCSEGDSARAWASRTSTSSTPAPAPATSSSTCCGGFPKRI